MGYDDSEHGFLEWVLTISLIAAAALSAIAAIARSEVIMLVAIVASAPLVLFAAYIGALTLGTFIYKMLITETARQITLGLFAVAIFFFAMNIIWRIERIDQETEAWETIRLSGEVENGLLVYWNNIVVSGKSSWSHLASMIEDGYTEQEILQYVWKKEEE